MDKALLDKIRKCLALGRSDNANEAAAALAKARALMDAHGITEAQLAMAEIGEATARASRTRKPPRWEVALSATVCRALAVTSFLDGVGDRTFVGRGPSSEIASYAFAVLFRRLKAERRAYIKSRLKRCKPVRKRQRADLFCEAWAFSVFGKVRALFPEPSEDETVGQYLAERYPDMVPLEVRKAEIKGGGVTNDLAYGSIAGSKVDLNTGLHGSADAPRALT
ncbi:DUF7168 domain-containing protein [Roseibium aggregatum]|uniref:DUF7168 domain-containing protein n=1 Tax=Roseibium aggregatum TaxID=187304 RepID=UPI0025ACAF52|nr:DUF2786 domain-containing protein [Roseibium aggregatum]WJS05201.1 DUF2786 domain-containing protein [Roseibium aggregatum]